MGACTNPALARTRPGGGKPIFLGPYMGAPQWRIDSADLRLPCGKCSVCRKNQARDWAQRIYHESLLHEQSSFLTLTYATERKWIYLKDHYDDVQNWFKRMRHVYGPLRYFGCAEAGSITRRLHYHVIVFGHDFLAGSLPYPSGDYYIPQAVEAIWGLGNVVAAPVTPASAAYVAGYCDKKDDEPPARFMSTNPGIGREYLERFGLTENKAVINGQERFPARAYARWMNDATKEAIKLEKLLYVEKQRPIDDHVKNAHRLFHREDVAIRSRRSRVIKSGEI